MTPSDRSLFVAAVAAVAAVPVSKEVVERWYFGFSSSADILAAGLAYLVLMGAIGAALGMLRAGQGAVLKSFLLALALVNAYFLHRAEHGSALAPWAEVALVASVLAIVLVLMFLRAGPQAWRLTGRALLVASVIFVTSPLILAWSNPPPTTQVSFARQPDMKNLLFLVLDETSPEYAQRIVSGLQDAGLTVKWGEVAPAGQHTLNAIPAMLLPRSHDDVAPCSGTSLCGGQQMSFSSLRAQGQQTDIVAFHHPYCSIAGLRSCVREEAVFEHMSAWGLLRALVCKQVDPGAVLSWCLRPSTGLAWIEGKRRAMAGHLDAAPFWRQGGLLYVHYPLPHPTIVAGRPLRVDYEQNVRLAEQLVAGLTTRLQARFGVDFTLIITSDHPLRVGMWCGEVYRRPDCATGLAVERNRVPFIIASPRPLTMQVPATNLGILAGAPFP